MKKILAAVALFALGFAAQAQEQDAPAPQDAAEAAPSLSDLSVLEPFVDSVMEAQLRDGRVPGAAIAIVQDGEILFAKGYGLANVDAGRPVEADRTVFRVGSIAKPFAATAVLQLVERGVLDLDVDVNTYLTAFQLPDTYPEPITLRHLLTHTAGFEERITATILEPGGPIPRLSEILPATMPARVHPPGEVASYSNWGFTLAGHIVEAVTGLSFVEYADRELLSPLGMESSTFREPLPAPLAGQFAIGYQLVDGAFVAQEFEYISEHGPAGALSGTVTDMAHFMIAQLQLGRFREARILSEDSARMMQRRHFTHDPRLNSIALSFGLMDRDGRRQLGHTGGTFSFETDMALLPDEGVGVIVTYNARAQNDEAGAPVRQILDRYFPAAPAEAGPLTPPEDFAERAARYVGAYRNNRANFTRLEKYRFINEFWVLATDRNTLVLGESDTDPNAPGAGPELVEIDDNLFRTIDEGWLVAFREDQQGRITQLFFDSPAVSFDRIGWHETIEAVIIGGGAALVLMAIASLWSLWRTWRRSRRGVARTGLRRALDWAVIGASGLNLAFAIGFAAVLWPWPDPFSFPPGTSVLLVLPVLSLALTVAGLGGTVYALVRGRQIGSLLLGPAPALLLSAVFLWFLDMWNMLGWKF